LNYVECSTGVRRKSGTEMRGEVGERTDGVVMRYEVDRAYELVRYRSDGLLRRRRQQIGYTEWSIGRTLSVERDGDWAAFGPRTSGN
jgi:hypothetical protein